MGFLNSTWSRQMAKDNLVYKALCKEETCNILKDFLISLYVPICYFLLTMFTNMYMYIYSHISIYLHVLYGELVISYHKSLMLLLLRTILSDRPWWNAICVLFASKGWASFTDRYQSKKSQHCSLVFCTYV